MNNPNMQPSAMAGRAPAGLHHFVQHYRMQLQQQKIPPGWQQSMPPEERGQLATQFFTQYRLLKPDISEVDAMRASLQFETQNFLAAQTKDQYMSNIKQKLIVMTTARQEQLRRMQGNLGNPMNGMNPAQMNMMGPLGPQPAGRGTPTQFNPAFPNPQLQRPMQISPVPMSQQPSMGGNPANAANGPPGQTQNNQQQMAQNQQNRHDSLIINQFAKKLMEQCKEEVRQKFQADVQAWPEERKQQLMSQNINPLFFRFRQHAEMLYRRGANNNNMQPGVNQNVGAMQQPGQPNRMPMNMNQRQPDQFDFTAITNQQMEAMRSQDSGATVVPASNNPNGAQVTAFPGQNQQAGQPQAAMAQRQAELMQRQQAQQAQQHAQAQAQAQARIEQQRRQAQGANPQNQLLQGLNGGLNLHPGQQQSPSMPLLTRPMPPPGQPGPPTTPQQQPPQAHVPIMTPQPGQSDPNMSALMREAQQRAAAVSGVPQQLTDQIRMNLMPADLDPSVKNSLLKVPDPQFRAIIQNYRMNAQRQQNGQFPMGATPNQAAMFNAQQPMQPGIPGQGLNGSNIANMARPGINFGQQPQPQQPGAGQQLPMGQRAQIQNQQQRLAAAQNLLRQNPGIIHTTDHKPFPPNVLNDSVRQSMPPDVKTWFQLKQWATQNPALLPNVDSNKLLMLQVLHFQDIMRSTGGMINAPNQQPQNAGPGLAPPAQLTPNQGPLRPPQPINLANLPPIQVTQQEIQIFRQRLQGTQPNITDDQLRSYIHAQKLKGRQQQHLQQQQQQQQLQLQQQQHQQQQQQHQQQQQQKQQQHQQQQQHQHQQQQQHQQLQQQMLNQQQMQSAFLAKQRSQGQTQPPQMPPQQQQPPNRPPTTQPQPTQATPQPKPAPKPSQPAQPPRSTPANTVTKTMKRPNDDASESNDAAPNSQAPPMVASRSQQPLNLTQEQISKLTPAQQAKVKAQLLKAQETSNNKMQQQARSMLSPDEIKARMTDPVRIKQFKQMLEEVEKSIPPRQPVQLPPQLRTALQQSLKAQLQQLKKVEQALRIFHASYDTNEPESVIRQIMKARALVFQQINEEGVLHAQVTLTTDDFKTHMRTMINFVRKITEKMAAQQAGQNQNPAAQQSQQAPHGSAIPPAQLNAENLKIVEQQQRQQKPPSAPTTERLPFPLDPGHGAAHYFEGIKPVTNLILPEKKRAKLEPGSQTPTAGVKASPRIGSGPSTSPELKRQPGPDKQVPQRPTFKCQSAECEYSVRGFDTQAELEMHVNQTHAKIENPLQFTLDSMAEFLEVDQKTGEPKADSSLAKRPANSAPTNQRALAQPIKSENVATPTGQPSAATPMARMPTQTGIKGSPSTNLLKTPQTMAKVATPGTGTQGKATPASMVKPAAKEPAPVVPEPSKEEEQPFLPMSVFDYSYEDTFAALDANEPFTVLDLKDEDTAWMLRSRPTSPITTPESSSKDTPSTRQSDISENDNLHINIDIKDADMPDAWAAGIYGDGLPMDMQISDDLASLGVMLPPMDSEDMMLFPSYDSGGMMDLDMLEKTMDSMGGALDPTVLAV